MDDYTEITLEEFCDYCNKEKCLRKTIRSKKCELLFKQEICYKKFLNQKEKVFNRYVDKVKKEMDFTKMVHERDETCRIWNILTKKEKTYILQNFFDEYVELSKQLDVAHIISRSNNPSLIKEESNVVLMSRYFHQLLDEMKHPITGKNITTEERFLWFRSAVKGKRFI